MLFLHVFFAKNLSGSCVGFRRISSKNQKFRRKTKNFVGIRRMIFLDFSVSDVNFLLGSWHIWTKATFCSLFSDARQPKRRKGELFDDLGRWYERSRCHRPPFPAQTSKFNWTVSVLSVVDACTCTWFLYLYLWTIVAFQFWSRWELRGLWGKNGP